MANFGKILIYRKMPSTSWVTHDENISKWSFMHIVSHFFSVKKLPQSALLIPRPGIDFLKEDAMFGPVKAADFRTDEINFDLIMKTVGIICTRLPLQERMTVQWFL